LTQMYLSRRIRASRIAVLFVVACAGSPPPRTRPAETAGSAATQYYTRGREAADRGDTVRAEQYLSVAIERGFDAGVALPLLLRVCVSSSRLRSALNHGLAGLRKHPQDPNLRYLVAAIHFGLHQFHEARLHLHHLLRLDPSYPAAHYLLGVLESAVRPEAASTHFRTYLTLDPSGEHAEDTKARIAELAVSREAAQNSLAGSSPSPLQVVTREKEAATESVNWFETSPLQAETTQASAP